MDTVPVGTCPACTHDDALHFPEGATTARCGRCCRYATRDKDGTITVYTYGFATATAREEKP